MEISCKILTKKCITHNNYDTVNNIKMLNLINITKDVNSTNFLNTIKQPDTIMMQKMEHFIQTYFDTNNANDVAYSLLYAYYLSAYHNKISNEYSVNNLDSKLINASHRIVAEFELMATTQQNIKNLLVIIDRYYSLYKLWSTDIITMKIFDDIQLFKKHVIIKHISNNTNKYDSTDNIYIINVMKELLNNNFLLALKQLLLIYYDFKTIPDIKNSFWDIVTEKLINSKDNTNQVHIITISLSIIRKKLIDNVYDQKKLMELYYDVDIDDAVNQIVNNTINKSTLQKYVQIISKYFNKTIVDYDIDTYENMLKTIISFYEYL